ncbi:MAG: flavin reductase family protein [Bacilli bacterium]
MELNMKNSLPSTKVVVTVRDKKGRDNALVVAYCGNCSYDPIRVMIGIVPSRFSYHMVKENGCFVVHLLDKSQKKLYECAGTKSGRDGDKLKEYGIKLKQADTVNAGYIEECPIAIECKVVDSIVTGSHEMFIADVLKVHCDETKLLPNGRIDFSKYNLM